jgi:MraZ protein
MSEFFGRFENKRDSKGRVSVPHQFRAQLRDAPEALTVQLLLRPSLRRDCIDVWPHSEFAHQREQLAALDPLSDEYEMRAAVVYGDVYPVESDKEGRIVLPDPLVKYAGVTDAVMFVGMGRTFEIWEPQAAERRQQEARQALRDSFAQKRAGSGA